MENILLIDIGSTFTKVTAVDIIHEKILGTARGFTTIESDINEGLEHALENLQVQTGKLEYPKKYACSSCAGGLKMVAVGLVPDLTVEAAKMAALGGGARVMKTYSYELCSDDAREIERLKPDIVLLSGGTDGGNKKVILYNTRVISKIKGDFPVIVAGNRCAASEISDILSRRGKEVHICRNVMPEFNVLNIESTRKIIREVFLKKIIKGKGLTRVQDIIKNIIMPTPMAVQKAVELLSTGFGSQDGLGELFAVDVGGATPDIYSISDGTPVSGEVVVKGLPEPFVKRTVEGDLGVRYSAQGVVEAAGIDAIALKAGLAVHEIEELGQSIRNNSALLGKDDMRMGKLDYALSSFAVKLASDRHAGKVNIEYTLSGKMYMQYGKDLTGVKAIVGTGGPVIGSIDPKAVLKNTLFDNDNPHILKPKNAKMLLDKKYILSAMGLLGEGYPEAAIRIMKKELELI